MHGKWSQPGVPHSGWSCEAVDDLGSPSAICEMCETQEIRYVHTMSHPNYSEPLDVGCVCAERMENDCVGPRKREQALRNATGRRRRWLSRQWRTSAAGNAFLNTDGFNITIFPNADGSWGGRLLDQATDRERYSKRRHPSENAAKLAAFDAMIFLKTKRGWGDGR